jgi:Mg-chelatase subunit ChlD
METVRLAGPWVLALVVPVWAAILFFVLGARPRRAGAWGRAILLCLATGLLALAATRPSIRVTRSGDCPVLIVQDVSASMRPHQHPDDPGAVIVPYVAALPTRRVGLVQFAGGPLSVQGKSLEPARNVMERMKSASSLNEAFDAVINSGPETLAPLLNPDRYRKTDQTATDNGTDIMWGLSGVYRRMGDAPGIAVLYTDTLDTEGDPLAVVAGLAAQGIQVHAIVPPLAPRDVRVAGISGPATAPVGRKIRVEVRLASTVAAQASIRLTRESYSASPAPVIVSQKAVALGPASPTVVIFEDTPPGAGLVTYMAGIKADDENDDWPENNFGSCTVVVGDLPPRIEAVYASKPPEDLAGLLRTVVPPDSLAWFRAEEFTPSPDTDIYILDNVSASALGEDRAQELARLVTDGGAGLLVLGGDSAFTAGGYGESPLEDLLPVTSRTARRSPMEVVFVVDSSGSMNETLGGHRKITLAKQAVLALRPLLAEGDRVGVVAFAGEPRTVSPLVPMSNWDTLAAGVREIEAGGGTRITPAIEAAVALLGPQPDDPRIVRHIIFLSDGRSDDFDTLRLFRSCQKAGATISTVATGDDADVAGLTKFAKSTGGRGYEQKDLAKLASTFAKDLTMARGEGLRGPSFPLSWHNSLPVWKSGSHYLPLVNLYNPTETKKGAGALWLIVSPGKPDVPALAVWQRGLGRVAAMPWSVDDPNIPWQTNNILGKDLHAILDWLHTTRMPTDWSARLVERGRRLFVRVEERTETIGKPREPFIVSRGSVQRWDMEQVAPGVFETEMWREDPWTTPTPILVTRHGEGGGREVLSMPNVASYEYQRFGVDWARLEEIVKAGGGRIHTSPESLAAAVREFESRAYAPVGLYVAGAALAVIMLLVGLRLAGKA